MGGGHTLRSGQQAAPAAVSGWALLIVRLMRDCGVGRSGRAINAATGVALLAVGLTWRGGLLQITRRPVRAASVHGGTTHYPAVAAAIVTAAAARWPSGCFITSRADNNGERWSSAVVAGLIWCGPAMNTAITNHWDPSGSALCGCCSTAR